MAALALGPAAAQEQPKTPHKVKVDDCVSRAVKRAKGRDEYKLARVTCAPNDSETLCVVEYASGEIGVFSGAGDPTEDQYVVLTKENATILAEALGRAKAFKGW